MERDFEVLGLAKKGKPPKKVRFVLSLESDDGEKLSLHLPSQEELEKHHIHEIMTVKIVAQPKLS